MLNEGYIKYQQDHIPGPAPSADEVAMMDQCRARLWQMGFIGALADGTGYGNISTREAKGGFIISGTQTGHLPILGPNHYTRVTHCDIEKNYLRCVGPVKASSEALTHAAVYAISGLVRVVIHMHSAALWRKHLGHKPTTGAQVSYGSTDMALEVGRLYGSGALRGNPVIVMAGHQDGLLVYGLDFDEALGVVMSLI
ncbi:MAG: class II aldolase/adducin family protein [Bacteroidetes bacterium]|jgi:hypothetical protein|nr:class II aldolase/adducin family protein [Bacteroidota bacterium]